MRSEQRDTVVVVLQFREVPASQDKLCYVIKRECMMYSDLTYRKLLAFLLLYF